MNLVFRYFYYYYMNFKLKKLKKLIEPHILLFRRPVNYQQQLVAQDQNQIQQSTTVH